MKPKNQAPDAEVAPITDVTVEQLLAIKIADNGSNMSAGTKQLLCLARALLNQTNVLILDEATFSVDAETDKITQETIRSEFKHKTILSVVHRLDSILDNDKILVLDAGQVKEFDTPEHLLNNHSRAFY